MAIISIWVRIIAVNMPFHTSFWADHFDSLYSSKSCLRARSAAFEARFKGHLVLSDFTLIAVCEIPNNAHGDGIVFGCKNLINIL